MNRVPSRICFLFIIVCLQLACSANRSELDVFVMEGAREIGRSSNDGHEEVFFVITAEYPAHDKVMILDEILIENGYKHCMPVMPEWQSYYDVKVGFVFDRQLVGVRINGNNIVFIIFSYKGLNLNLPGNAEMFVSVQGFKFSNEEDLESALKYLNVQCKWLL